MAIEGGVAMYKILYSLIFSVLLFSCSDSDKLDPMESDKLAPVQIGSKYGYINRAGKIVIKPLFDQAGFFQKDWLLWK